MTNQGSSPPPRARPLWRGLRWVELFLDGCCPTCPAPFCSCWSGFIAAKVLGDTPHGHVRRRSASLSLLLSA